MSLRRMSLAGALAVAAVLAVAIPAAASTVDKQTDYAAIRGRIEIVKDTTSWDFVLTKLTGTTCVYAKVTVVAFLDQERRSGKVCPDDPGREVEFKASVVQPATRAARVDLCKEVPLRPDHCTQVWYEPGPRS